MTQVVLKAVGEMPAGFAHVPRENLKTQPEKHHERVFKVSYLHVPKKEVN